VYSIFVSRLDVYTEKAFPTLSAAAQGEVGIVNAKRIWAENKAFWNKHKTPLEQEMIFASTGTKKMKDGSTPPAWKYVEAFAGSDIETNPPKTNDDVEACGRTFTRNVDKLPPKEVLDEIDRVVDMNQLERDLMAEGLDKFAEPQKALIKLIKEKMEQVKK
jgi:transaldolase